MKVKTIKIVKTILAVAIIIFMACPHYSKAVTASEIISGGEQFLKKGDKIKGELFDANQEQKGIDQIYFILLGVAIVAAFIVGTILGIQFITSGAAGQAKVKEKIIPYIVGLFVVFGAFGIWKIALNLGRTLLEAPPAYLISNDEVKVSVGPANGFKGRIESRTHTFNIDNSEYESTEYQDLVVYVEDAENVEIPIAHMTINLIAEYTQAGGFQKMYIVEDSVKGNNGFTATYDKTTSTIQLDKENPDNVKTGEALCSFTVAYEQTANYDGSWNILSEKESEYLGKAVGAVAGYEATGGLFGTAVGAYAGGKLIKKIPHMGNDNGTQVVTYATGIDSLKCYDKDNNDITKHVNIGANSEITIKYKIYHQTMKDAVIDDVEDKINDGVEWVGKTTKKGLGKVWDTVTFWD